VVETEIPPLLRGTILVDAPVRTVAAALAEPWLLRQALTQVGMRARTSQADQFRAGDQFVAEVLWLRFRVHATVAATGAGTLLTYGIGRAPHGLVLGRRLVLRLVRTLLTAVRDRAEQLADAPVVVGAVITDGATVLAAQRDRPQATAGRWEFPGGKVEPAEDEPTALARECKEELAADVEVGERLGPDLVLPNGWVLRLYLATLVPGARPVAGEHRALRWVTVAQFGDLDWLDADRVVLPGLAAVLGTEARQNSQVSPGQ
jgi:8-oxo-dGTP diphosphatase